MEQPLKPQAFALAKLLEKDKPGFVRRLALAIALDPPRSASAAPHRPPLLGRVGQRR